MEKMDGKTMDIVAENVDKLKELFPEAFTEDGTTEHTEYTEKKKIDWDVLREVLGEYVSDKDERYSFTWNGKSKARMIAQMPSTGTLRPCKEESVDWDTTQNIFIEGDNLEVLKLLQKSYHKKVKMIYIDPPYNTGKDFVYKDNFKDNIKNYKEITGQVDGEGRNLSNNPETSGRYHTDWLNMMYPRLKLARNLLKDDGVIFISIDDNEVSNLRKMCDEIFGEENFIANFIWEKRTNRENRKEVSYRHDNNLCYIKNRSAGCAINQLPMNEKALSNYGNPDDDPRGSWKSDPATAQAGHGTKSQFYELKAPNGRIHRLESGRCWLYTEDNMNEAIDDNRIWFGKDGNGVPRVKTYLHAKERGLTPESIVFAKDGSTNEAAKNSLKGLFEGIAVFETPKPVDLIRVFLQMSCKEGFVVDFFAGSSASAHAVMQLNAEDNGNRKFIMVQLPETTDEKSEAFKAGYKTIAEISKERIRRAGKQLKMNNGELTTKDNKDRQGLFDTDKNFQLSTVNSQLDTGFKVFKLDSTNIKPWEVDFDMTERTLEDFISNIKTDRREEDVLYEVLLKYGLDLTLPIKEHAIAGKKVFDIGMGALIICLADAITLEVVEGIAKLKDELNPEIMRVVFKDSGFKDDVVKTNAVQILKQAGIVDVRSL